MSITGAAALGRLQCDRTRLLFGLDMVRLVGEALKVDPAALRSKEQHRSLSWARDIAAYVLRERGGFSYPEIGALLGGRDHSSVMAAVRRVAARNDAPTPGDQS